MEQLIKIAKFTTFGLKSSFGSNQYSGYTENELMILQLSNLLILLWAVYILIKCVGHDPSKHLVQIMLAVIFSPFYIIYRLFKPC